MTDIGKGLASISLGIVCGVIAWKTNGETGLGWLALGLFIIWGFVD